MPKKKSRGLVLDPSLELKTRALRDDPLVHEYRDVFFQLYVDSLHASGQHFINREKIDPLTEKSHKRLVQKHEKLREAVLKKYHISGFDGDDPFFANKKEWLSSLTVSTNKTLRIETNWAHSRYLSWARIHVIPKESSNSSEAIVYQDPPLPEKPTKDSPPTMTLTLDLSQIKRNNLDPLVREFKEAIRQCLDEVPRLLKKRPSVWRQNIDRDYTRFQLHQQGMPFRWIAYQEKTGKHPSGAVRGPIPTESSVRESVERVYLTLFGKKHSAWQHKASLKKAPLKKACDQYNCSMHGRECPFTCEYFRKYQTEKIEPLLK